MLNSLISDFFFFEKKKFILGIRIFRKKNSVLGDTIDLGLRNTAEMLPNWQHFGKRLKILKKIEKNI